MSGEVECGYGKQDVSAGLEFREQRLPRRGNLEARGNEMVYPSRSRE